MVYQIAGGRLPGSAMHVASLARMRLHVAAVAALLVVPIAGCGDDGTRSVETTDTQVLATVRLGTEVHYAGFTIQVAEAVHRPGRVTVSGTAANLGPVATTPPLKASLDDGAAVIDMDIDLSTVPVVKVADTAEVAYAFRVPRDYDLDAVVLRFGAEQFASPTVPLGSTGALKTNAPLTGLVTGSATVSNSVFTVVDGELRYDEPTTFAPIAAGRAYLTLTFSLGNLNERDSYRAEPEDLKITTPTGEILGADDAPALVVPPGGIIDGLTARFNIPTQPGAFTLELRRRTGPSSFAYGELSFEILAFP